jgi:hypothetical protein
LHFDHHTRREKTELEEMETEMKHGGKRMRKQKKNERRQKAPASKKNNFIHLLAKVMDVSP